MMPVHQRLATVNTFVYFVMHSFLLNPFLSHERINMGTNHGRGGLLPVSHEVLCTIGEVHHVNKPHIPEVDRDDLDNLGESGD